MDYVDIKYINLISSHLRNFKRKSNNLYNCSCPLCGDSHRNKRKARGYIFEKENKSIFYCHNCNQGRSLPQLLKEVNHGLYAAYCLEIFGSDNVKFEEKVIKKPTFIDFSIFSTLKKISELSSDNPFKLFLDKRKIPTKFHSKLYACPNFMEWTNVVKPNKFNANALLYDEPRLIIPFIDRQKNVIGYQGRTLQANKDPKYITILLDESRHPLYGLDIVDLCKTVYVLEGPFDSMFIPNALAVTNCNLPMISSYLPKDHVVLIFDNEKRNENVIKTMKKAIENEYKIVIWPHEFEYKDINDAIIAGETTKSIMDIINSNIHKGLSAKLTLGSWSNF